MLRTLICLGLLLVGPLAAEQIDNIVFSLPDSGNWSVQEDVSNSFGHATIYSPNDEDDDDDFDWDHFTGISIVEERFQILATQLFRIPFVQDNAEDFEKWMQIAFPFLEMHCKLVENTDDSITVELFGYDDGELDLYSIMRKMRSQTGTVLLTYSCDAVDFENLDEVKDVWMPIILNAKQI